MPVEVQKHIGVSTTGGDLLPGETRESVDAINKGLGSILTSGTGLLVNAVSIDAMSDEDATMAGTMPDTEFAEASAATLTDTPLAYSDQTGTIPVIDYEPGRARWWPVAALVAVILAVTGGAAGVILWLGHHPAPAQRAEAVEPEPAVTPGPLNGIYRFEWHDGQATNRMPDGGVEPVTADMGVDTLWFAIRSRCEGGTCTATHVRVDDDSHSQSDLTKGIYTMTLVDGQWRTSPEIGRTPCATRSGEESSETTYTLMQLPDGTLTGQEVFTVTSNECGIGGMVRTTPISATRTGDIPPTVTWNE